MSERMKIAALGAIAAIVAVGIGAALAVALDGDDDGDSDDAVVVRSADDVGPPAPAADDDAPLPRGELGLAADAAERIVGGGEAVDVERSDDPGEAYEVEVLTDRGEVDVALDANLNRVPNAPYGD